jgi:hypothetical protein
VLGCVEDLGEEPALIQEDESLMNETDGVPGDHRSVPVARQQPPEELLPGEATIGQEDRATLSPVRQPGRTGDGIICPAL